MRSRIGIGEAADLAFLGVYQPADTVLRCMAFNKWAVLVWHLDRPDLRLVITPLLIDQRLTHCFANEPRAVFAHGSHRCIARFIEPHTDGFLAEWFLSIWHLVLMLLQVFVRSGL